MNWICTRILNVCPTKASPNFSTCWALLLQRLFPFYCGNSGERHRWRWMGNTWDVAPLSANSERNSQSDFLSSLNWLVYCIAAGLPVQL